MGAGSNAPVIIKRVKKVSGGGHHGGAWKVAYADFVTAMMAFFLLMWLLNATTEQQLKGLADYFSPVIPISRTSGGSDGMFGGDAMTDTASLADDGTAQAHGAMGQETFPTTDSDDGTAAAEAAEVAALRDLETVLLGRGGESILSEQALRHVVTRLTDEGLVIEIFSLPDAPLFEDDSDIPLPATTEVISAVARLSDMVINHVAVGAHLPARPVVVADNPVWAMSADRALVVRQILLSGGLDPVRMARVTGHADRRPAQAGDPGALRNDRIEIIFLRDPDR
jgi:chemotaxis protein MotB